MEAPKESLEAKAPETPAASQPQPQQREVVDTRTGEVQTIPPTPTGEEPGSVRIPEIIRKIDRIISERAPVIIARLQEARDNEAVLYRGMTRSQIRDKFQVSITGSESYAELRKKAANAAMLFQEANGYLQELMTDKSMIEERLVLVEEELNQEVIAANMVGLRNERLSDKSREILARRVYNVGGIGNLMGDIGSEMVIWTGVLKGLAQILKAIDMCLMALGIENKYTLPGVSR